MRRVALTGGIATGKSHVLEQFRRRGVPCLDADSLARGVTAPGTEATRAIAARFGEGIVTADGSIDRARLAAIVFADPAARRDLEALIHPAVYRAIGTALRAFEQLGAAPIAVVDIPLLYESGHERDFDDVIVTVCPPEMQLQRLIDRGLTETEARQRIAAQWPTDEKARRAPYVIRTDGTIDETNRQVAEVLARLTSAAERGAPDPESKV
jgi:dephospho-CoA kinase